MIRIDQFLVNCGYAPSRSKAQELIKSGVVFFAQKPVEKPSQLIDPNSSKELIEVRSNEILKYVSRAGLKLQGALQELKIKVTNKICLDVGQSTGGFTHCLLNFGAQFVVGVEVGSEQLHDDLRQSSQVQTLENTNIRDVDLNLLKHREFDLIVVDLSFISLRVVVEDLKKCLKAQGEVLALVKPQFELGPKALNKRGIVKNKSDYQILEREMVVFCQNSGYKIKNYIRSPILGGDGNEEFFIHLSL